MKKLLFLSIILTLALFSCDKNEEGGTFTLTMSDGTKYDNNYVEDAILTKYKTFRLNQSVDTGSYEWILNVLIEDGTSAELVVLQPSKPKVGVEYTYVSSSSLAYFYTTLDHSDLPIRKTKVTFSEFSNPGRMAGVAKGYDSSGKLLVTGNFDFYAK